MHIFKVNQLASHSLHFVSPFLPNVWFCWNISSITPLTQVVLVHSSCLVLTTFIFIQAPIRAIQITVSIYLSTMLDSISTTFTSSISKPPESNHHRGPKWKLRAGYRVPSLQKTSWSPSTLTKTDVMLKRLHYNARHIFHCWLWCRVYSMFGHHPHP